jgi:hypothetical protein
MALAWVGALLYYRHRLLCLTFQLRNAQALRLGRFSFSGWLRKVPRCLHGLDMIVDFVIEEAGEFPATHRLRKLSLLHQLPNVLRVVRNALFGFQLVDVN